MWNPHHEGPSIISGDSSSVTGSSTARCELRKKARAQEVTFGPGFLLWRFTGFLCTLPILIPDVPLLFSEDLLLSVLTFCAGGFHRTHHLTYSSGPMIT